ncbi:hypothetical protein ACM64Y_16395, partial [Novispirillum sp. DQ9]|uniref:hypothetical protein n=1 Tax=Novispirillum sp. DQ9 TaxID=3398612 RepID=UPI003C7CA4E8
ERILVQEQVDSLPRAQLPLGVLRVNPTLAPAKARQRTLLVELFDNLVHRSPRNKIGMFLAGKRPD